MLKSLDALLEILKKAQEELSKDARNPALAPKDRKVAELKAKIDAGTYKPDPAKIADKMVSPSGQLKVKKDEDDVEKSNYGPKGAGQYTPTDNIKRKAKNLTEEAGEGPNKNVKAFSTKPGQMSAKEQATAETRKYKAINRKQPVRRLKDMSPEEQEKIKSQYKIVKDEDGYEIPSEPLMPILEGKEKPMKDPEQKKLNADGKSLELIDFNKCGQWMIRDKK